MEIAKPKHRSRHVNGRFSVPTEVVEPGSLSWHKSDRRPAFAAVGSAVVFSAAVQPAEASFVYSFEQTGTSVIVHGSGSFNTTALGAPIDTLATEINLGSVGNDAVDGGVILAGGLVNVWYGEPGNILFDGPGLMYLTGTGAGGLPTAGRGSSGRVAC
ncbi:MAG: hypothetical protein ACK54F_07845 [Planctomycetia bacterium]|jgi:hypothetical protein